MTIATIKKGEIIELDIEKLVYGGEGIGRFSDMTIFVTDTVPGDRVKAEIVSVKKNYAKAVVKEILQSAENRVKPFCGLANTCGGCQWQYIDYEEQLKAKKQMVEESLEKIAGIKTQVNDTLRSPETRKYRCKVQFPVGQTKVSKRVLAGYYKKGTHEIINIKHCPVQPELIDKVTAFLREKVQELQLPAYNEKNKKGLIRHFVYRYSWTNSNFILTIVINNNKIPHNLVKLCNDVKQNFPQAEGVAVNFNTAKTNVILGRQSQLIAGKDYVTEIIEGKTFRISQDAFFQVNPSAASQMFMEVKKLVEEKTDFPKILDIYAGAGGFSIFLSDVVRHITAIESAKSSVNDGLENIKQNNISNMEYIKENAEIAVPKLASEGNKFDVTILDPPRKGCSEEVLQGVMDVTDRFLVYISCNPATLARDMKVLKEKFRVKLVQPVDMFCHTYHVETILLAERIN